MGKFFKDFGIGLSAYGKALEIIFSKGLWWFFIFPVILNVLFFFGGFALIDWLTEYTTGWAYNLVNDENATYWGVEYVQGILSGFIWLVFKILFFFVFAYLGGYIVIIFMAPVFSILSEKTEKILTGKKYPFDADQLMRDIVRGVLIAFRNLFIELVFILAVFMLSFIPVVGQLGAIFLFFVSSYFYGFSFMDYTVERQRYSIAQSVDFIRKNKGIAVANGVLFSVFMLIPFCGYTLAGFVSIISVVAATISTHKVLTSPNKIIEFES
ncbi:MAG: EI24 domain-containing protein [Flavobacteriales bacterium]